LIKGIEEKEFIEKEGKNEEIEMKSGKKAGFPHKAGSSTIF